MKKVKKYLSNNWIKLLIGTLIIALALFFVFTEEKEKNSSVTATEWKEKVEKNDYTVTILTLSYCGACKSFYPIITELQEEYGFDMYKFEIDTINESEYNMVSTSFEMKNYDGHVPYTVIFKSGQFIADNTGYLSKEDTLKFLKDNGVIE